MDFDGLRLDPPVFDAPVYFVNLTGRRVASIEVFGTPGVPNEHSPDQKLKGFIFTFADGSTEIIGQTPIDKKAGVITFREGEEITDLRLHFAVMTDMMHSPTKLCGVQVSSGSSPLWFDTDMCCCQFITNKSRELSRGHLEKNFFKQRMSSRDREDNETKVVGLQIGLTPVGIMSMGLVYWRS